MGSRQVLIYISEGNSGCNALLKQLDQWKIPYKVKNVSKDHTVMKELQDKGIYGTPATFVDSEVILGLQHNKLKQALGIKNNRMNFGSD